MLVDRTDPPQSVVGADASGAVFIGSVVLGGPMVVGGSVVGGAVVAGSARCGAGPERLGASLMKNAEVPLTVAQNVTIGQDTAFRPEVLPVAACGGSHKDPLKIVTVRKPEDVSTQNVIAPHDTEVDETKLPLAKCASSICGSLSTRGDHDFPSNMYE